MGGERVVLATVAAHDLGKFAWCQLFGALEQKMFKEMGNAGLALGSSAAPTRYQTMLVTTGAR